MTNKTNKKTVFEHYVLDYTHEVKQRLRFFISYAPKYWSTLETLSVDNLETGNEHMSK